MEWTPASLGIVLSRLSGFTIIDHHREQYVTPSQIASDVLYLARSDVVDKRVLDLGVGTGIFALGAALMGGQVTAVESDEAAVTVLKANQELLMEHHEFIPIDIIVGDVQDVTLPQVDVVIMNPPFGTKQKGIDTVFLHRAFECAPVIWSMHKTSTMSHIKKVAHDAGYNVVYTKNINFALPKTHKLHTKAVAYAEVTIVCLRKS